MKDPVRGYVTLVAVVVGSVAAGAPDRSPAIANAMNAKPPLASSQNSGAAAPVAGDGGVTRGPARSQDDGVVWVRESGEDVVFLHRLQPGGADRSYGIEVGRLAGLPASAARERTATRQRRDGLALQVRQATAYARHGTAGPRLDFGVRHARCAQKLSPFFLHIFEQPICL